MRASMNERASVEAWLAALEHPAADRDYKPGHARMHALLEGLPLRRPRLRIRIAGTNGKGSTAWMLAAGLCAAGLRVGLYTSPHILRFNERIRIDGRPLGDAALLAQLARIAPRALECGASWFEAATALALTCFSAAGVDVEILEAGVGARLDATTAVAADMALITPIGLDHQAWLGETLAAIAHEKAHAASGCEFAFSAPQTQEAATVLGNIAPHIRFAAPWPKEEALTAPGRHQRINAGLAWAGAAAALEMAGLPEKADAARRAIALACPPGRLQCVTIGQAELWLDAAHNRHALEALLPWLADQPRFDAIVVFTREDRSLEDGLALLRPFARALRDGRDAAQAGEELASLLERMPQGRFLALGSFRTLASIAARFPEAARALACEIPAASEG